MFCGRLEPENVRPFLDPLVKNLPSTLESACRPVPELVAADPIDTSLNADHLKERVVLKLHWSLLA